MLFLEGEAPGDDAGLPLAEGESMDTTEAPTGEVEGVKAEEDGSAGELLVLPRRAVVRQSFELSVCVLFCMLLSNKSCG